MIRVVLVLLAIIGIIIIAANAPRAMGARRASPASHAVNRSALFYQAASCFHVAPRQWVCPEPAP